VRYRETIESKKKVTERILSFPNIAEQAFAKCTNLSSLMSFMHIRPTAFTIGLIIYSFIALFTFTQNSGFTRLKFI